MKNKITYNLFVIVSFVVSNIAHASVVVDGTRLIFENGKNERALHVNNPGKSPELVQSWIEDESGKEKNSSFIITPPLFRLNPGLSNVLRVTKIIDNLPNDKESLFWINIKSIPQAQKDNDKNQLQIAIKTRIKLIYRPQSVTGAPTDIADKLIWRCHGSIFNVFNPTPFYINFYEIKNDGVELKDVTYVSPYKSLNIISSRECKKTTITWKVLNDFGGVGPEYQRGL
ncbi:hypothetical protein SR70_06570 [Klebsiella aerogenes]|uniref:fimbrial biogenesis chaperone n=1 Tax=Klebsiella aerogenes TaxID=548 RepID=UPI0005ED4998|nr:molecular chaperone [Klebsiella aerogenes]ELA2170821.1 molecular chaperone [Klebsiella aerogenes]KJP43132.1 hypothetical protein SR70_06570 [Klebsiella aerogenes]HDU4782947.1 molecular chaperone [Klebsiella aerogenes]HEM8656639.1 molecular chaperone [Klebsiella aerogenes]